ncbi:exodeoxyribonuclease III [Alphaproteobacteria bacterium LSUCC0684]
MPSDHVTIASWNVNSIKVRAPQVVDWLKTSGTDILFMQEIKCVDDAFPREMFEAAGYTCHVHGQKTYNGVAIATRIPLEDIRRGLPDAPDQGSEEQARFISARLGDVTLAGLYMPNGNPTLADDGSIHPKLSYKLDWMKKLAEYADGLNQARRPVIFLGDFNIIPGAMDAWDIDAWKGDALHHPETLALFRRMCWLGYTDAFRGLDPNAIAYSFWDYQGGAWQKDHGIRIDHILANAEAMDRMREAGIDKTPRGNDRASDHTPVWCRLTTG